MDRALIASLLEVDIKKSSLAILGGIIMATVIAVCGFLWSCRKYSPLIFIEVKSMVSLTDSRQRLSSSGQKI